MTDLTGIRFYYVKTGGQEHNFETVPFYNRHLRRLLLEHWGEVAWLVGNTGGIREAYLIFHDGLKPEIAGILTQPLMDGGHFDYALPPWEQIWSAYRRKQLTITGFLQLETTILAGEGSKTLQLAYRKAEDFFKEKIAQYRQLYMAEIKDAKTLHECEECGKETDRKYRLCLDCWQKTKEQRQRDWAERGYPRRRRTSFDPVLGAYTDDERELYPMEGRV